MISQAATAYSTAMRKTLRRLSSDTTPMFEKLRRCYRLHNPYRPQNRECPYMDSPSFASNLYLADMARLHTYIRPLTVGIRLLMPGHNGLFARQLPIALSYFEYVDIPGFSRRRSHLFAIIQFA